MINRDLTDSSTILKKLGFAGTPPLSMPREQDSRYQEAPILTKAEFTEMLNELANAWERRDYGAAMDFFSEDIRYADPTRYQMESRAGHCSDSFAMTKDIPSTPSGG